MIKSSYVTLTVGQRGALQAFHARAGTRKAGWADLCSGDTFQTLIDKGLVQAEKETGRWSFTPRGQALAKLIASESRPYEKAYYLTAYEC